LACSQRSFCPILSGSDAAGNGLAQAFATLETFGHHCRRRRCFAACSGIARCGAAAIVLCCGNAGDGSAERSEQSAVSLADHCLDSGAAADRAALQQAVSAWFVAGLVWGGTITVSAAMLPMAQVRQDSVTRQLIRYNNWAADFARLSADAPLWQWTPLLATQSDVRADAVLTRIRQPGRRQEDAETMLQRGDFPLRYLGRFDLIATPSICAKARALLRKKVETLLLKNRGTRPYAGHDCSCDAEARAWETMANAYRNPEWDVYELRDLRATSERSDQRTLPR
jgi:hypothetical protein